MQNPHSVDLGAALCGLEPRDQPLLEEADVRSHLRASPVLSDQRRNGECTVQEVDEGLWQWLRSD